MPVSRSEFTIAIKTEADLSGARQSLDALKEQFEQAKKTGGELGVLADQINTTRDAIGHYENSIRRASEAESAVEASGHEVRHGLHLTADALAQIAPALGSIGELAPMAAGGLAFLIPAAAIEAIQVFKKQMEETRQTLLDNIKTTMELREAFEENFKTAVIHVNESLADFNRIMAEAGRVQNEFADRLANQTAMIDAQAQSVRALAQAQEQLIAANIEGAQQAGQLTGPQAAFDEEHNRERARAAEEQAERARHAAEIAAKRQEAADALAESGRAEADVNSATRTNQRVRNQAAVSDATTMVQNAKNTADREKDNEATAKAAAIAAGARPSQSEAASVPGLLASAAAAHAAGATGTTQAEAEALDIQKRIEAYKNFDIAAGAHKYALDQLETASKHLSEATIKNADFEKDTDLLRARAAQLKAFAADTNHAADAQERLNAATEAAHGPVDAVNDEAARQRRRNYLTGRSQSGQLTPDEEAEFSGVNEGNPRRAIQDAQRGIARIEANTRSHGGQVSAEDFKQLRLLNDRLIGLVENVHGVTETQTHIEGNLLNRVQALESRVDNHQQLLAATANTRR